jgi:hypothetical protein
VDGTGLGSVPSAFGLDRIFMSYIPEGKLDAFRTRIASVRLYSSDRAVTTVINDQGYKRLGTSRKAECFDLPSECTIEK